jgi:hypothetical protein
MGGVRDGGGVREVSYGIQTFVFAGEGVKLGHKGGDFADHVGTYCSNGRMCATAKHMILCVVFSTKWTG